MTAAVIEIGVVDFSAAAVVALLGVAVQAYRSGRVLGPERRKIVAEAGKVEQEAYSARIEQTIAALEATMVRLESENARLRLDHQETQERLEAAIARLEAVTSERDDFARRVSHLERLVPGAEPPA